MGRGRDQQCRGAAPSPPVNAGQTQGGFGVSMSFSESWRLFRKLRVFSIFFGGITATLRSQISSQETPCPELSMFVFERSRGPSAASPALPGPGLCPCRDHPRAVCLRESDTPALATLWSPGVRLRAGGCRALVTVASTGLRGGEGGRLPARREGLCPRRPRHSRGLGGGGCLATGRGVGRVWSSSTRATQ